MNGPLNILIVANDKIPTVQLSFLWPLAASTRKNNVNVTFWNERDVRRFSRFGLNAIQFRRKKFDLVIFSRYSGPGASALVRTARKHRAAVIYHLDDDLLNVPLSLGERKYSHHNDPSRLATVRYLLQASDLIYASNERLASHLKLLESIAPIVAGNIYCASDLYRAPSSKPRYHIGYMGFDHAEDFALAAPAVELLLQRYPQLTFTMFGPVPVPESLRAFGERVHVIGQVRDYESFRRRLAEEQWDVGLCPLVRNHFNLLKSNTKWVEYTASGMATVASAGTIYDSCCADGCGVLVGPSTDEWVDAVSSLLEDNNRRVEMVRRAQARVETHYSVQALNHQLDSIFQEARRRATTRKSASDEADLRILALVDAKGATQTISFMRPLSRLRAKGACWIEMIDEATLKKYAATYGDRGQRCMADIWQLMCPTVVVLSRYAGGLHAILPVARSHRIPIIYHLDDDLFAVPEELGQAKFQHYNEPKRVNQLAAAVKTADLVYASTPELARRLSIRFPGKAIVPGEIYCAHNVVAKGRETTAGSSVTLGYMGTAGHAHDLDLVVPAIVELMEKYPDLRFETFGTIQMPEALSRFGDRVAHHKPVTDYDAFVKKLASLDWHIGLAPLVDSPFNRCKADTKWVEYTAAGIAVAASEIVVYERACADGAGMLVADENWFDALARLIESPSLRAALVSRAQEKLSASYSPRQLEAQVCSVFTSATAHSSRFPAMLRLISHRVRQLISHRVRRALQFR